MLTKQINSEETNAEVCFIFSNFLYPITFSFFFFYRHELKMDFFGYGGGGGFPYGSMSFKEQYRCYSIFSKHHEQIQHGGKVIMPSSALEKLARLNISYPMLFKMKNTRPKKKETHCGVLEFSAEEGRIYVPCWMMKQLNVGEGDIVLVENVSLPLATYSKFQPQTTEFLDIHNPKAVLESKLRSFACLTTNDIIGIEYNGKIYELLVEDTKPQAAVSIIECDMKVDFSAPVGYKPPEASANDRSEMDTTEKTERDEAIKEAIEKNGNFSAFSGEGQRLDGKHKATTPVPVPASETVKRGIPNYNYKKGKLTFVKAKSLMSNQPPQPMDEDQINFKAFSGEGNLLRIPKQKKEVKIF